VFSVFGTVLSLSVGRDRVSRSVVFVGGEHCFAINLRRHYLELHAENYPVDIPVDSVAGWPAKNVELANDFQPAVSMGGGQIPSRGPLRCGISLQPLLLALDVFGVGWVT